MVKFLLDRPVAVFMAFAALFILGLITYFTIPVSLLPNIAIPEITVQISGDNTSARALENTVVSPIRQQLMQIGQLRDIHTETRDGNAIVRLSFEYGTDTDLAFVEVNEKIDGAMNYIPREIDRPRVIKASATDIPVLYLNLTLRSDKDYGETDEDKFLELSDFSETVIKRRIEQLPQVSMVDVTGLMKKQVTIVPDNGIMETSGITLNDLESALNSNNAEPGSMVVRDGHYEYNIKFSTVLRTIEDVQNIFIRKNDRVYRLKDLATVGYAAEKEKGMALYQGKRCIKMAVIKQSEENMGNMQEALNNVINDLQNANTDIEFHVSENQTELLDYTISNLQQNLILAFIFVWLISIFFMKDVRSPLIIGLSMVVSVVVSLLFFYLFHTSLNVVSLTGLILASGTMIDNSLIVTENIEQYRKNGMSIEGACIQGTNEVITPMLSSAFTAISVFVPLIFLSGIAGALFFDQAFSVTVGLLVSYVTGIMLLPVLYKLVYEFKGFKRTKKWLKVRLDKTGANKVSYLEQQYHRGIEWIFRHKKLTAIVMIAVFPCCIGLFILIPKEKMPDIRQKDMVVSIEWNENVHVTENLERTKAFQKFLDKKVVEQTGLVGQQQYLLNREREKTSSETEIYLKVNDSKQLSGLKDSIQTYFRKNYANALVSFAPAGTIFEKVFSTGEPDLVVEYYARNRSKAPDAATIRNLEKNLSEKTGETPTGVSFQRQLNLQIDREKLLYYNISYEEVYRCLRTAFKENTFATLRSFQQYLPVVLGESEKTVREILDGTLIEASNNADGSGNKIALNQFVSVSPAEDLKTIVAGRTGEYIPIRFNESENPEQIMETVKADTRKNNDWETDFSGSFFSNKKMIGELSIILIISTLLMFFILAAQFESFVQPLIVLLEIPIDITASLALLLVCGHTMNLMSAIGIVVTCGIVINDSILKVDIMNQLRKEGMPLMAAIHEAGHRRLKSILMTSLTSIVCMIPLLFSYDLGSELEKPLALATIGGMVIGTPVSLFVVPLFYWWIYRKTEIQKKGVISPKA